MRPPILWITIAFAAGLWFGLEPGQEVLYVVMPLLAGATFLLRRAPVGAALGLAAVAGLLWGEAALARRDATCAGRWGRGNGDGGAVAAIVRLVDPVSDAGGLTGGETRAMMDLLHRIREGGTTIMYIEHEMKAIMSVCDRITVLNFGQKLAEGKPQEIQNDESVIEAYLGKSTFRSEPRV